MRSKVLKEVKEWARSLPFKSTVILVGSYARGDFNLWSDIDVVVIAGFKGNPVERLRGIEHPPGFEVIPLTPEEFAVLLSKRNPLTLEALERGVVLRDDLNFRKSFKTRIQGG